MLQEGDQDDADADHSKKSITETEDVKDDAGGSVKKQEMAR
jgi:hypothetical protein